MEWRTLSIDESVPIVGGDKVVFEKIAENSWTEYTSDEINNLFTASIKIKGWIME